MCMDEDIEKIKAIVRSSNLSEVEKARWEEQLETLPPFFVRDLASVLEDDPGNLTWMTKNWEMKEKMLSGGGKKVWDEIITQEEKDISSLLEKS